MTEVKRSRIYPGDGDPRHGTPNGYRNLGCHCDDCKAANAKEQHRYMHADPVRLQRHAERMAQKRKAAKKKVRKRSK